jgi:hypothetical protein
MATGVKIQLFEDSYRLVVNGEESEAVGYGEPLEAVLAGERWLAFADVEGGGEGTAVESVLDSWVYRVAETLPDVEIEDVDAGDGEGETDEDEAPESESEPDDEEVTL